MGNHEKTEGRQTPTQPDYIKGKPHNTLSNIHNRDYAVPTYLRTPIRDFFDKHGAMEPITWSVNPEPLVLSEEAKEAIRAEFNWQISYGMYGIPHPKYPMHWRYL